MQTPPYEAIAEEYYDAAKHPTCAAFRHASLALLHRHLDFSLLSHSSVVEVGCGRSVFCDLEGATWDLLCVIDESAAMLEHSKACLPLGATCVVGNACSLELPDDSVDVIVSSLGDPYNLEQFWREANRVLRRGGSLHFTTPSAQWASTYRPSANDPDHCALFMVASGEVVETPSFILAPEDQKLFIRGSGLEVSLVDAITLSELDQDMVRQAPKLSHLDDKEPIVVLYICRKP